MEQLNQTDKAHDAAGRGMENVHEGANRGVAQESNRGVANEAVSTAKPEIATPEIMQRRYRFVRLIGEGSYAKTYLAVDRVSGAKVAVKQLKTVGDFKSLDLFRREVETMKSVDIDGVPKYLDYVERKGSYDDYYIVQEFIDGRSLLDCIDEMNESGLVFAERIVLDFANSMVQILFFLETQYQPPIIHRDIKPSNILLTPDMKFYLIDFGAVANPERKSLNSTIAGTQGYMAPEQLMGDCTIQSDYYGLGATMLHMITGVPPYKIDTDGMKLQFEQVIAEQAPHTSERMIGALSKLLAVRPEERPKNCAELYELLNKSESEDDNDNRKKKWNKYDLKSYKDRDGHAIGKIQKVIGQNVKTVFYTFECNDDVFVGYFNVRLAKYDEKEFQTLYAKNPELFSEFVDNIENNDYLIGAKVNVKYNFGENSCGSRLAKDQDEVRIQLLEPWIKKGEISYNPFVLEESEVNPVMKIPAEERSLFSIGIGFH